MFEKLYLAGSLYARDFLVGKPPHVSQKWPAQRGAVMGQVPVSPAEGKMQSLSSAVKMLGMVVGKQEKSCGTSSDAFQQLALARDSTKTLEAPSRGISTLGCRGWVCHPQERKESSERQFPLRPLWSSAEPQHPLSLQPQLLLPMPTAKPLDESSPSPFSVAPKPAH